MRRFFDVLLSLALLTAIGYGGYYIAARGTAIDPEVSYEPVTEETTEDPNQIRFTTQEIQNQEIYNGSLILVNHENAFQGNEDDIVSLYQVMLEKDCHSFGVRDADVKVRQANADALINLFNAFYNETYDNNISVQSGYRSRERQQELYDEDLAKTGLDYSERVSVPGHSEHQTGWCVDLDLVGQDYDGTGIYSYIDEHCFEYGLILRYPENKTEITQISYESWHYRYVGRPHAFYIMHHDLCLEEYIGLLYKYPYDGEHLEITDFDGEIYEVYYYPAELSADVTQLSVPENREFTISGNNRDGFIVTVDTGETGEIPQDVTEETESSEEAETTADENQQ